MGWKCKLAAMLVGVVSGAGQLMAQDAYLAQVYGEGVHRYFRCETLAARSQFDKAINFGSRDPRVFYFRAIISIEAGDSGAALSDVRQGARYELEGRGTYDVWRALDRVQGSHRIQFESQRRDALLALRQQSVTDRYPIEPDAADDEYLRRPTDPLRTPLEPDVPSMPLDDASDPFANDEPPAAPSDEKMLDGEDLGLDDIDSPADQPPAEVDDPFADDGMVAPDESVEAAPADAAAEDPFADDTAADDPFADDAASDDPFADDAASDDPFADDSSAMDAAPAEDADDPFGDDASGAEAETDASGTDAAPDQPAEDDDPFGGAVDDDPFGDIFE